MRILKLVTAMLITIFIGCALLFGWYKFRTYHLRVITVEDYKKAAPPCLKRLSVLVDEAWFNRPYYEVSAISNGYNCLFFKYETDSETLYIGHESTSGTVAGTHMTQDQMRQFADTLNPASSTEQVYKYMEILSHKNPPVAK